MMAFTDVLFGKSEALRLAERRLVEREDQLFSLQEGELEDLRVHVRADMPRHELLKDRVALNLAMTTHLSNRNLLFTLVGLAIVFAKLWNGFDWLFKLLGLVH